MNGDPITAALRQLAAHARADRPARRARGRPLRRDQRPAHPDRRTPHRGLGGTVKDHAAALAGLEGLDEQVAALAAQLTGDRPAPTTDRAAATGRARRRAGGSSPAEARQEPSPGCGRGWSRSTGPATGSSPPPSGRAGKQHDLCLYGLDIAAELWSVLYLQATRTPALLSAQAEYQTRILPALAEQLMTETSRCGHAQARRPLNGQARSTP